MRVTLLAGGTGGARLAHGFQQALPDGDLTVVVNVGDDTELFGLHVSPDVDSVLYTLAGMLNPGTGWGVAGDTWTARAGCSAATANQPGSGWVMRTSPPTYGVPTFCARAPR